MRIGGGLTHDCIWPQPVAEVEVINDIDEKWGESAVRRLIAGTVTRRYPHWERYFGFWMQAAATGFTRTETIDGRVYFTVSTLLVDHDVYPFPTSLVNVEGPTVRLAVAETYYDDPAQYRAQVVERNRRVDEYIARIQNGQLTANDLRELTGLQREQRFENPIPPTMLQQVQAMLLDPVQNSKRLYNVLH